MKSLRFSNINQTKFTLIKHTYIKIIHSILLILIFVVGILGYILFDSLYSKIDDMSKELITLKQLSKVQEYILNDNFLEKE